MNLSTLLRVWGGKSSSSLYLFCYVFTLTVVFHSILVWAHDEPHNTSTMTTTSKTAETNDPPLRLTHALVHDILEYKGIYTNDEEEEACQVGGATK